MEGDMSYNSHESEDDFGMDRRAATPPAPAPSPSSGGSVSTVRDILRALAGLQADLRTAERQRDEQIADKHRILREYEAQSVALRERIAGLQARAAPTGEPSPDIAVLWKLLEAAYTEVQGGSRGRFPAQIALENAIRAVMRERDQAADNFDMMTQKWGEAEHQITMLTARAAEADRIREAANALVESAYEGGHYTGVSPHALHTLCELVRPTASPAREPEPTTTETSDAE